MKHKNIFILFLFSVLLYGCSTSLPESTEDIVMEISETFESAIVVGPVNEPTLDNLILSAKNTYQNVCSAYDRMQNLAGADDASKKGRKAANKVEKKYAGRINELSKVDFSLLTEDELCTLSAELTDMITAIREATDALTLG